MDEQLATSRRQFLRRVMFGSATVLSPLVAACSASSTSETALSPQDTTDQTTDTTTSAPGTTETIEVTHWDWYVSQSDAIDDIIATFQTEHPNITINRTVNNVDNNNYANLFQLAIRGDTVPDVFMMPQDVTIQEQVANGWLADLSQFNGFADFKSSYPNPDINFLEGTNTISSMTYSAPFTSPNNAMWIQMWVNTKVFQDAGLADSNGEPILPVTAEEFLDTARTITEQGNGNVYGYGFAAQSNNYHWPLWMAQLSGAPGGQNGLDHRTGEYTLSKNPAYRQVIDVINTLRDEELILPESGSLDDESLRFLFSQNTFGLYLNGDWIVNSLKDVAPDFQDYTVTAVPLFGTTTPQSYFYAKPGGQSFAVSATSKQAEAAWEWFKFLHSAEAGILWVKGGNGLSVHPTSNNPEYIENPALAKLATLGPDMTRFGPDPSLRNAAFGEVKITNPEPGEREIMQGIYTGQITDIDAALEDLDTRWTAAREQAIADAQAAGADVRLEDWIFADWDITEDYLTTTTT